MQRVAQCVARTAARGSVHGRVALLTRRRALSTAATATTAPAAGPVAPAAASASAAAHVPASARIFSGIQPTGALHLGNYLGAVRQWVQLQNQHHDKTTAAAAAASASSAGASTSSSSSSSSSNKPLFALVDLHALTIRQDPEVLRAQTRAMAATLLACGLRAHKTERAALFVQSQVRAHAELSWLLGCVTPHSWMQQMTQFKEKSARMKPRRGSAAAAATAAAVAGGADGGAAGLDAIDAAAPSVGLFVYPVLQTADILLYQATHVPVGDDQRQHLELARRIAARFNALYPVRGSSSGAGSGSGSGSDSAFSVPQALFLRSNARVMSLRDPNAKMSKSDPSDASRIQLDDDADTIASKIRRAVTDSVVPVAYPSDAADDSTSQAGSTDASAAGSSGGSRPAVANLLRVYAALTDAPGGVRSAACTFPDHATFKRALTDAVVSHLAPIRSELRRLQADPHYVDAVLRDGQQYADAIAQQTMKRVRDAMGLPSAGAGF